MTSGGRVLADLLLGGVVPGRPAGGTPPLLPAWATVIPSASEMALAASTLRIRFSAILRKLSFSSSGVVQQDLQ